MGIPSLKESALFTVIPGLEDIPIGWAQVDTYADDAGNLFEVWVPVVSPQNINPKNLAILGTNIVLTDSTGKVIRLAPDSEGNWPDELKQFNKYTKLKGDEISDTITAMSLATDLGDRFGISIQDQMAHSGLKSALTKYNRDLTVGILPPEDYGQRMMAIRARLPSDTQMGPTLSGDAEIKKYNDETVQRLMGMPLGEVGSYLDNRQKSFGLLMGSRDIGQAIDYFKTLPFDTEQERLDMIMTARRDYAAAHGVKPNVATGQQIGDLYSNVGVQKEQALAQSRQNWQNEALTQARAGVTQMPEAQFIGIPDQMEQVRAIGGNMQTLATANTVAANQRTQGQFQMQQEAGQRRKQWLELVEQARNRTVQRQRVATL